MTVFDERAREFALEGRAAIDQSNKFMQDVMEIASQGGFAQGTGTFDAKPALDYSIACSLNSIAHSLIALNAAVTEVREEEKGL